MKIKKKDLAFVECECGARIYGTSKSHDESLLPAHRRSKLHKQIMEIKKREKND